MFDNILLTVDLNNEASWKWRCRKLWRLFEPQRAHCT